MTALAITTREWNRISPDFKRDDGYQKTMLYYDRKWGTCSVPVQLDDKNGVECQIKKHLWSGDEKIQIDVMRALYNSFPDDKKPEWLTMADIERFAVEMKRYERQEDKKEMVF